MAKKTHYPEMDIVDFAYQIISMSNKVQRLEDENARLAEIEEKYNDLLQSSMQHSQHMMGNLLEVLMTPCVGEAFVKGAK